MSTNDTSRGRLTYAGVCALTDTTTKAKERNIEDIIIVKSGSKEWKLPSVRGNENECELVKSDGGNIDSSKEKD